MGAIISEGFLKGYGKALNLGGIKVWPDIYDSEAKDYNALRGDWEHVGTYIRESSDKCGKELSGAR